MTLSRAQWETVLSKAEPRTFGEVVRVLEEADTVDGDPTTLVEDALAEGILTEDEADNWAIRLSDGGSGREEPGSPDANPGGEAEETTTRDADLSATRPSGRTFYPAELKAREWWVNWVLAVRHDEMDGTNPAPEATPTKQPVAPYDHGDAEPTRWNFGLTDEEHPSTDFDTVERWNGLRAGVDVHAPERVQSDELGVGIIIPPTQDDADITLLDWDDVRDPDTGEVHPVCARALEEAGGYAEISQSGEGIHQFIFGEIPGGFSKFLRHVDEEPFVGDDLPMVEMYSSGRLTAMTGRHVEGTGEDVVEGQGLIDRLCWEYGDGTNNSPGRSSDPFATDRDTPESDAPSHEEVGDSLRKSAAFDGDDPDGWDIPDGESVVVFPDGTAYDHDTERCRFLRETMNLRVVQTSGRPLPYHGKLDGKNFGEDLELVLEVAEKYTNRIEPGPDGMSGRDPSGVADGTQTDGLAGPPTMTGTTFRRSSAPASTFFGGSGGLVDPSPGVDDGEASFSIGFDLF